VMKSSLIQSLASLWLWMSVVLTLALKRYIVLPWLQQKLKRNFVQRQKLRQRRLQETFQDPVLMSDLERKLTKRYQGDTHQALQTMDRLRMKSEQNISSSNDGEGDSSSPRGEERREASTRMLLGTFMVAIVTSSVHNLIPHGFLVGSVQVNTSNNLMFPIATIHLIAFYVVHIVDSLLLYQKEHNNYFRPSNTASGKELGSV